MEDKAGKLRERLAALLAEWKTKGVPSREGLKEAAERTIQWRKENGIAGLWPNPPLFVTATIDDGWGHGLQLIESWADALGLEVRPLGLMKKPGDIVRKCRESNPDFLGMTILQFDSEDDVAEIAANLPPKTRMIAGGPLFAVDPDLAERAGIHAVAKNAAAFVAYMLDFELDSPAAVR